MNRSRFGVARIADVRRSWGYRTRCGARLSVSRSTWAGGEDEIGRETCEGAPSGAPSVWADAELEAGLGDDVQAVHVGAEDVRDA